MHLLSGGWISAFAGMTKGAGRIESVRPRAMVVMARVENLVYVLLPVKQFLGLLTHIGLDTVAQC